MRAAEFDEGGLKAGDAEREKWDIPRLEEGGFGGRVVRPGRSLRYT